MIAQIFSRFTASFFSLFLLTLFISGAGTFAGGDGSRQPTKLEQDVATAHGKHFAGIVNQYTAGKTQ